MYIVLEVVAPTDVGVVVLVVVARAVVAVVVAGDVVVVVVAAGVVVVVVVAARAACMFATTVSSTRARNVVCWERCLECKLCFCARSSRAAPRAMPIS
jgi:hypothetical protein